MDAQGVIHFLGPDGATGRSTAIPAPGASQRSTFAVSPDDTRIAVTVATYTATQSSTRLYVEDLNGGGHHLDLFSERGTRTLWAVGWHGTNNLVVAVVASCTAGGGPFCCGMLELHVVDPMTANRRFTIGGSTCIIAGPPSASGAVCEETSTFTKATVLTWTAATARTFSIQQPTPAYLSPDGTKVAVEPGPDTAIQGTSTSFLAMRACAWIDDSHLISGGDPQHPPRVGDMVDGTTIAVAASGDCGGRLPGGL